MGEEVGARLVEHPDVSVIAFTGSRPVGLAILRAAAAVGVGQRQIKRAITELGGKNPIIVDADADPDEAVPGIAASAFGFAGQKCSAASRLIVHRRRLRADRPAAGRRTPSSWSWATRRTSGSSSAR